MSRFNVGDCVERIGSFSPTWIKEGIITRIVPNEHSIDWATEYEVDFGEMKETFYQSELRHR